MSLIAPVRAGLLRGRLYRHGLWPATDSEWLDQPGQDDVLVRLTHALGLPGALPEVQGLAVRVPLGGGGHGDLVFAGTLWGRFPRVLGHRGAQGRPLSTVLPYRTVSGEVLVAARANGAHSFELSCAAYDGEFRVFADLRLSGATAAEGEGTVFDPAGHVLPGLETVQRRVRDDRTA